MMTWHWPSAAQLADIIKTAETSTLDEVLSVVTKYAAGEMDSTRNHIARLEKEVTALRDQIAEMREGV
jgi:polyhydroxyalkanoate synthesis regulator phasin